VRIGLYTITYLGIWYRGEALPLTDVLRRAHRLGFEGIELDTKRPHSAHMDLSASDRERLRDLAGTLGLSISAVSPNCDLSSHVPEQQEAMICYVRECIRLTAELGAPICKVFAAWPGVVVRDGLGDYTWTRSLPDPFPQWSTERKSNVRTALQELSAYAEDQGVTIALQNHGPVIEGHEDVYDLIEQVGSPALKACIDLPADKAVATDPEGARALGRKVGGTMVHAHYFGQFKHGAASHVELDFDPPFAYPAYVHGLVEAGYMGYMNWEFCRPAVRNGEPAGIEFVDEQTELALAYMKGLRAAAREAVANAGKATVVT
jgi:sugar phosphate isomerase/epimerase